MLPLGTVVLSSFGIELPPLLHTTAIVYHHMLLASRRGERQDYYILLEEMQKSLDKSRLSEDNAFCKKLMEVSYEQS